jgi:hypothetical protein
MKAIVKCRVIVSLAIALGVAGLDARAAEVSLDRAMRVASHWLTAKGRSSVARGAILNSYTQSGVNGQAYHIFNFSPSGFVIVAADDVSYPIVGWSADGIYVKGKEPPALTAMLEVRKNEIDWIKSQAKQPDLRTAALWQSLDLNPAAVPSDRTSFITADSGGSGVSPMLSTCWDQGKYYNDSVPELTSQTDAACGSGSNHRAWTGCVATAMGQVMKYWNYPSTGRSSLSYQAPTYGTLSADFGNTAYNWAGMPSSLSSSTAAVATLLSHTGISVEMSYSDACDGSSLEGSAAYSSNVPRALSNYFRYSRAAAYAAKADFPDDASWVSNLKAELDAGRPIYYEGFGTAGGHAFIIDGYQPADYFHINWGWSCAYNGYFYLTSLNPDSVNFTEDQGAIYRIIPDTFMPIPDIYSASVPSSAGGSFKITVDARNSSSVNAPAGSITLSFPNLTNPSDDAKISLDSASDGYTIVKKPAGSQVLHKLGYQFTASYLMVEISWNSWASSDHKIITMNVAPQPTGYFPVKIRSWMSYNSVPANAPSSGNLDQQGWECNSYYVSTSSQQLNAAQMWDPSNGTAGISSYPTVQWYDTNSAPQEQGYKVRIKPANGSYTYYTKSQNATSHYFSGGLAAGTTYYWNVQAIGDGANTSDSRWANNETDWSFTTQSAPPGAFSKSSPSNGATAQSTSPTLSWGSSSGATSYEYCYNTSAACGSSWTSAGSSTSAGLSGLSSGTTYYWQVRARNAVGTTDADSGTWWSFTTQTAALPGAFSKSSPSSGATAQSTSLTLSWGSSSGATSYEYCYNTSAACGSSWTSVGSSTSAGISGLSSGTTYYWQVRARNAAGTTDADSGLWWSFTTQVALPGAFSKSGPSNGATAQSTSPTLSWGSSSGAASYEYCYNISASCGGGWTIAGSGANANISGLSNGTTYYWQVRARNAAGTTDANGGTWWSFTTQAALPGAFAKGSPSNGATAQLTGPTLSWGSSSGAASYEYCYNTTAGCGGSWTSVGNSASIGISGLSNGTTYYWQVRARNAAGTTDADSGTWWSFTTQAALPGPFAKNSPSNGAAAQSTSPMLSWGSSSGATSYEYCYNTSAGCSGNWTSAGNSAGIGISGLSNGTTYYWQVRARNAARTTDSDSGIWWSFTTQTAALPGAFSKSSPSGGATGQSTSPTLSWGSSSGATSYEFCYNTSAGCGGGWTSVGNSTSTGIGGLSSGTTYYWQVQARNAAGTADADSGIWWTFTTQPNTPGSSQDLALGSGAVALANTGGSGGTTQVGYSKLMVHSGDTPYGTAVFSFKEGGVTVSEAGVPASPPTTSTRIFIDYRSSVNAVPARSNAGVVDINTGIAVVNYGAATANVTYTLKNSTGNTIAIGHGTIAAGRHLSCFIDQLKEAAAPDFILPADFQTAIQFGALDITSDQPLSVISLRGTSNQKQHFIITTTPVADLTRSPGHDPIYFAQFADGGGYTTSLILMNTSAAIERGTLQIRDNSGNALAVNQVGGSSGSSFPYSIPPNGILHFQTDGSPASWNVGWIQLTPDSGSATPIGSGIYGYNPDNVLVSESGVPSAPASTHTRIYVDRSGNHDTGLAVANINNAAASITIKAFQADGMTSAGTSNGPLSLAANGHDAQFADQLIAGLPTGFTGILDISSTMPFAALTVRSLINENNDFLITTFPVADMNQSAPSPIVFPQIADGGGYVTQFILLSAGGASSATIGYYGNDGTPLAVGR